MAITAAMVKELREMTGAGMMDCKKALTNTDGDMDAAVEFLRENGLAKAAKKAGRIAAEGLVAVAVSEDAKEAAIVEVNSETDFVAKNDTFRTYVAEVADQALTTKAADIEGFLAEESKAEAGKTVKEALDGKIAVIGENLNIRRFAKVSAADGFVASYIHAGGKIGVLVEVATDVVNDEIKEMAKNVAMQVAAISPKYTLPYSTIALITSSFRNPLPIIPASPSFISSGAYASIRPLVVGPQEPIIWSSLHGQGPT